MSNIEKTSVDIYNEIKRYFIIKTFGTFKFVKEQLLTLSDIRDIDIAVSHEEIADKIRNFLIDNNYTETKSPLDQGSAYAKIEGSLYFVKTNQKPIHIMISNDSEYSISELIKKKWELNRGRDLEQLFKVITNEINKRDQIINDIKKNE